MPSYIFRLEVEIPVIADDPEKARRALARRTRLPTGDQGTGPGECWPEDWEFTPCEPHEADDALVFRGGEA